MWTRLRIGLWWGGGFAVAYIVLVLLIGAFQGSAPFERSGTTLPRVIVGYVLGGIIGGTVFGLLLPLGRSRMGAALLGFIVAVPVMHVVMLAVDSSALYGAPRLVITFGGAILLGPLCGLMLWYLNNQYEGYGP